MTSASTGRPVCRSISTSAPTGAGKPATAAVRPSVRHDAASQAGRHDGRELGCGVVHMVFVVTGGYASSSSVIRRQLCFELLVNRAKFRIDAAAAGSDGGIGDDLVFQPVNSSPR